MKIIDIIGNQDVNMYLRGKIGLKGYVLTGITPAYFPPVIHFFPPVPAPLRDNDQEYADLQDDIVRLKGFIEIAGGR